MNDLPSLVFRRFWKSSGAQAEDILLSDAIEFALQLYEWTAADLLVLHEKVRQHLLHFGDGAGDVAVRAG